MRGQQPNLWQMASRLHTMILHQKQALKARVIADRRAANDILISECILTGILLKLARFSAAQPVQFSCVPQPDGPDLKQRLGPALPIKAFKNASQPTSDPDGWWNKQ